MLVNNILRDSIVIGQGLKSFSLGEKLSVFYKKIEKLDYYDVDVKAVYPNFFIYSVQESIDFYFNIFSGNLTRIDLYNKFQGKFNNIGIGSEVKDLIKILSEYSFDENYILINRGDGLIIEIDYEEDIYEIKEVLDKRIKMITIESSNT